MDGVHTVHVLLLTPGLKCQKVQRESENLYFRTSLTFELNIVTPGNSTAIDQAPGARSKSVEFSGVILLVHIRYTQMCDCETARSRGVWRYCCTFWDLDFTDLLYVFSYCSCSLCKWRATCTCTDAVIVTGDNGYTVV